MSIGINDTLVPNGAFPVVGAANVGGLTDAALAAVPDATATTGGKLTDAQAVALAGAQSAAQVGDSINLALEDYSTTEEVGEAVGGAVLAAASDATSKSSAVRAGSPRCYATKAALRADAEGYSLNTRVMFDGDPSVYLWASVSTYVDDTSETSPVVQVGALAGRFVREGYFELDEIPAGSTTPVLWSISVPPSTIVSGEVDLACCTSEHVISGPLLFEAHRVGSAAPVLSSSKGAPWVNARPDTLPRVELSGSDVNVILTADPIYPLKPKLVASVKVTQLSATALPLVSIYRAAMLTSGIYKQLYYADAGITSVNDLVTLWANQSGDTRTQVFEAGNRPPCVEGPPSYLDLQTAVGAHSYCLGDGVALADRTIRWTMRATNGSPFSILFLREGEFVAVDAAGWNAAGSGVLYAVNAVNHLLSGSIIYDGHFHDYEIRVDTAGQTATLLVDGVIGAPTAIGAPNPEPSGNLHIAYSGADWSPECDLAAFGLQDSVGTPEQTALWRAMSAASGWV